MKRRTPLLLALLFFALFAVTLFVLLRSLS